jgi:S1-C subfamily serine protease
MIRIQLLAPALALALAVAPAAAVRSGKARSASGSADFLQFRSALVHVGHGEMVGNAMRITWLGTGFLVDEHCTVATAKHNLLGLSRENLLLRLRDPATPGATVTLGSRVIYDDPGSDLLFLRISESAPGAACSSKAFGFLPLVERLDLETLTGRDVLICGFPALEGEQPSDVPILRKGSVASSELEWEGRSMLLLDLTGIPGFSGGPVILPGSGEVVGVVFGPGRTDRRFDLEWATPITRADLRKAVAAARRGQ